MYEGSFSAGPLRQQRARAITDAVRTHCETLGLDPIATQHCITLARYDFLANNASAARAVATGRSQAAAEVLKRARRKLVAEQDLKQTKRTASLFAFAIIVVIVILVGTYAFNAPAAP